MHERTKYNLFCSLNLKHSKLFLCAFFDIDTLQNVTFTFSGQLEDQIHIDVVAYPVRTDILVISRPRHYDKLNTAFHKVFRNLLHVDLQVFTIYCEVFLA